MPSYELAPTDLGVYAKTLTPATVDTVTFDRDVDEVEVYSDGTAAVYFTIDGTTPSVAGQATYEIPAAGAWARTVSARSGTPPVVKLISSGFAKYSVTGR